MLSSMTNGSALRRAAAQAPRHGKGARVGTMMHNRRFASVPPPNKPPQQQQQQQGVSTQALIHEGKELLKLMIGGVVVATGLVASSGFVIERMKTVNPMPAPGQFIELPTAEKDGKPVKIHYQKRGNGNVTVIFDGGVGEASFDWDKVSSSVSEFATVVSIDRPGLGFSTPGQTPRTAMQIANEYSQVLAKLDVPRNVVLVAHGAGGYNMRQLANDLEQDPSSGFHCKGLVLVDALEENLRRELESVSPPVQKALHAMDANGDMVLRLAWLGLVRLITVIQSKKNQAKYSTEALPFIEFYSPTPAHRQAANDENKALPLTEQYFREASSTAKKFDFPCVVLSHGRGEMFDSMKLQEGVDAATIAALENKWQNAQRKLAKEISVTPSTQIIVADAGHCIHHEKPDEITKVVRALVKEASHKGDPEGIVALQEGTCPV